LCCVNGKSRLCVREIFSPVKLCVVIVCSVVCVDSVFSSVRETRWMSYAPVCFVPLQIIAEIRKSTKAYETFFEQKNWTLPNFGNCRIFPLFCFVFFSNTKLFFVPLLSFVGTRCSLPLLYKAELFLIQDQLSSSSRTDNTYYLCLSLPYLNTLRTYYGWT